MVYIFDFDKSGFSANQTSKNIEKQQITEKY